MANQMCVASGSHDPSNRDCYCKDCWYDRMGQYMPAEHGVGFAPNESHPVLLDAYRCSARAGCHCKQCWERVLASQKAAEPVGTPEEKKTCTGRSDCHCRQCWNRLLLQGKARGKTAGPAGAASPTNCLPNSLTVASTPAVVEKFAHVRSDVPTPAAEKQAAEAANAAAEALRKHGKLLEKESTLEKHVEQLQRDADLARRGAAAAETARHELAAAKANAEAESRQVRQQARREKLQVEEQLKKTSSKLIAVQAELTAMKIAATQHKADADAAHEALILERQIMGTGCDSGWGAGTKDARLATVREDGGMEVERQAKLEAALAKITASANRPKVQKQKSLSSSMVQPDPHSFVLDKALRKWKHVTKEKSISSKQWH